MSKVITRLDLETNKTELITMAYAIKKLNGYWKHSEIEKMLRDGQKLWTPYAEYFLDELIIQGTYSGHLHEGVMEWECPFTGELKSCQGEFECDGEYYIHEVTDDDGKVLYIVKSI